MSVIIGGVTCQEIVDGFEEGVQGQGPIATKKYLCDWTDRYALVNGLLGLVSGSGGSNPSVTLTKPFSYPESRNLWAREISIKGAGKPTQGILQIAFPKAIVTVNFGVPSFGYLNYPDQSIDPGNPYVWATQEIDYGREMVSVPSSTVKFAGGGNFNSNTPYAFPLPHMTMSITLHKVPYLPAAQIWTATKAPLNNATYLGIPAGYLMFRGARTRLEASTDGTYAQEVTFNFAARPTLRWDEAYDTNGTGGPKQVQYNGAAILLRSDLSTLIPSAYHA